MPGVLFDRADRLALNPLPENLLASRRNRGTVRNSNAPAFKSFPVEPACRNGRQQGNNSMAGEIEHDLAALVRDFLENGSSETDFHNISFMESELSTSTTNACDIIQALKWKPTIIEENLINCLAVLLPSIKETRIVCFKAGPDCNASCIRHCLVKNLRLSGYDAAICRSKWQSSGKGPGGEYEYISIDFESGRSRLIVDIDFRSQFQIARPTQAYLAALKSLPVVFVGSEDKLRQILKAMAEAARLSLKKRSMPLPPWRTFEYMSAKWLTSYEKDTVEVQSDDSLGLCSLQCVEQLTHICLSLSFDMKMEKATVKIPADEIERRLGLNDYRKSLTWIARQTG